MRAMPFGPAVSLSGMRDAPPGGRTSKMASEATTRSKADARGSGSRPHGRSAVSTCRPTAVFTTVSTAGSSCRVSVSRLPPLPQLACRLARSSGRVASQPSVTTRREGAEAGPSRPSTHEHNPSPAPSSHTRLPRSKASARDSRWLSRVKVAGTYRCALVVKGWKSVGRNSGRNSCKTAAVVEPPPSPCTRNVES